MSPAEEGQQVSSILRRRRLANEMRRRREVAGITINEVASHLYCSPSKISRMETARVAVSIPDIRAMIQLYHVDEDEEESLIQLALDARRKEDWWQTREDVPESRIREFIDLEAAAFQICVWETLLIPGLLQVPEYARRVIRDHHPEKSLKEIDGLVELRPMRQELLTKPTPAQLRAMFDEAALKRLIGPLGASSEERPQASFAREQLQRLVDVAKLQNVTIRMIPESAGLHAGMTGPFTVLCFPEAVDLDIIHFEHIVRDLYIDRPKEVDRFKQLFELLESKALTHDDTITWIADLLRELGD
jgi:transcriptional regulator with XRE-family HTH domain